MEAGVLKQKELTPALIDEFAGSLIQTGMDPEEALLYREYITELYEFLPEEKNITDEAIGEWRGLLERNGTAPRHIEEKMQSLQYLRWYIRDREEADPESEQEPPPADEAWRQERCAQIQQAAKRGIWRIKRVFDVVISLVMLIVLFPLLVVTAIVIYCTDVPRSSPIFTQTRVGLNGKPFTLYKFRTMVPDAEQRRGELLAMNEMDGPVFKIYNDPRITRIGRLLRRSSIDELPQFFNVLKGDMSLVGPRPPLPGEAACYTGYQKLKLAVKPGLTCCWQVHRNRNRVSFTQWLEMDLDYILDCTIWLDLKLMLQTPFAMLRGDGC